MQPAACGAGATAAPRLQSITGGEPQAAETLFLAASLLLIRWAFAFGVLLWRAAAVADPAVRLAAPGGLRPSQG